MKTITVLAILVLATLPVACKYDEGDIDPPDQEQSEPYVRAEDLPAIVATAAREAHPRGEILGATIEADGMYTVFIDRDGIAITVEVDPKTGEVLMRTLGYWDE